MKRKINTAFSIAIILIFMTASICFADNVVNNADSSVDAAYESVSLVVGGTSRFVDLFIDPANGDGKNGCNLTGTTILTISAASSNTSAVTVSPSSITFTNCEAVNTNLSTGVTVAPVAVGTANIEFAITANTTAGTFSVLTARFTVTVTGDTTPPVITPSISGTSGSNSWYTSDVSVSWTVTDPDSPVTSTTGCAPTVVSTDTAGTTLTCSATSTGGTASQSVTIKRDATKPAVTVTPERSPDYNGWYNESVNFTTAGDDGTSGIDFCTASQSYTGPDGTGLTVSGSCTDKAGNVGDGVSDAFKYDGTAPTAVLSVTAGTAGTNGWYTSDVTVHTSGTGSASGFTCTTDQYLTTESTGTTFNGSCTNGAGVTVNATPLSVKLDKTGPSAALAVTAGTAGANGWYTSDVTVSTSGSDSISGPVTCTADQYQTAETTGSMFNGKCTNDAGLSTDASSLTVKLDKSAPDVQITPSGTTGANGWFTDDVTLKTTGTDSISSPVACTPDQTQTVETTGASFSGSCTNDAGLSASTSTTVKLDKTAPTSVKLIASGIEGLNGWFIDEVTISTSGSDDISGVTCSVDQFQTAETAGTVFNGSCTNGAGLTTNAEAITVKLDKTAPTNVKLTASGTAGLHGWFTDDITIITSGSDDISGVTCSADQTQATETTGIEFNGSCTNGAGMTTDATPLTVKLDKTGPSAALAVTAGTAGSNGWYTSEVTVSTSGSDSISSPVTCTTDQYQTTETTGVVFNGKCTNDAGLSTDADSLTVKLDKTGPTAVLTPSGTLGESGWYVSDVLITTTGSDSISSPVVCSADQSQTTDTGGAAFNGSCTNNAGLKTDAAPIGIKRDATPPTLTWNGGPTDGATYYFGFVPVTGTCTASDLMSGPNGCGITGYSAAVGSHSMTAFAKDVAGNTYSETRTYTVSAWTLSGFFQPVDNPGLLNLGWNSVKNGSTVPLKFRIFAGPTELTSTAFVQSFTTVQVSCDIASLLADPIEVTTTGGTSLRYDTTGGQFIENWQTPKKPGQCYRTTMTTLDGSTISANFKLK